MLDARSHLCRKRKTTKRSWIESSTPMTPYWNEWYGRSVDVQDIPLTNEDLLKGNLLDEAAGIRRQELLVIAEIPKGQIQTAWNKQVAHSRILHSFFCYVMLSIDLLIDRSMVDRSWVVWSGRSNSG